MKNLFLISFILFAISCNSDSDIDCFKKQGDLTEKQISTDDFHKIHISLGIELIVSQSENYAIKVEYGKNLIDNIRFEVIDGELKIRNESNCEMLRNYHPAKVFVQTPVLDKIHSGSQYPVKSAGILKFPELMLEAGIIEENQPISYFDVEVDNQKLKINDNVSSIYKVKGKTQYLEIKFWAGANRFEGGELIADEVHFFHRSSNDIIVHPISLVEGKLAGTGNLVLKNIPDTIAIEQLYTGHVVYP